MSYLNRIAFKILAESSPKVIINKILKKEFDKKLGEMLDDASPKTLEEIKGLFESRPTLYGQFISAAEKKEIGFYEKNLDIPITKDVLKAVDDDYIINSILYSSVYYDGGRQSKRLTPEAISYAWERIKNPVESIWRVSFVEMEPEYLVQTFDMAVNAAETYPYIKKNLKRWMLNLSRKDKIILISTLDDSKYGDLIRKYVSEFDYLSLKDVKEQTINNIISDLVAHHIS